MTDLYQIYGGEGSALDFGILVSGVREEKSSHIDRCRPAINILKNFLTKIHLYLLTGRKLRHGLIVPRIRNLLDAVFLTECFHKPGYRPFAVICAVIFFQPVADLG